MSDPFSFNLDALFGGSAAGKTSQQPEKPEKGVQLRGKLIDGTFYIRAEDVADLLSINDVLPKATALLRKRTEGQG